MIASQMKMKLGLVFSLCLMVSIGLTSGQENTEGSESEEEVAKRHFTAIALSDLPYETILYRSGEEFLPIEFRNGKRSYPCPFSNTEPLSLYVPTNDPDPEKQFQLIARAPRIGSSAKMLYFILKNPDRSTNPLPFLLFGIDDSETKFPKSSFRFINFLDAPLQIRFHEEKFALRPRESKISKLDLPEKGEFTPFVMANTKGEIIGGTRIFSHATNREMILIFPPKEGKTRLDIRYFSD